MWRAFATAIRTRSFDASVDPGTLVPDVGHFEKILIEARITDKGAEDRLMGPSGARCHDDPVKRFFMDDVFDLLLGVLGTGEKVLIGEDDIGESFGVVLHIGDIDDTPDVDAAIADKDADPRRLARDIPFIGKTGCGDIAPAHLCKG